MSIEFSSHDPEKMTPEEIAALNGAANQLDPSHYISNLIDRHFAARDQVFDLDYPPQGGDLAVEDAYVEHDEGYDTAVHDLAGAFEKATFALATLRIAQDRVLSARREAENRISDYLIDMNNLNRNPVEL